MRWRTGLGNSSRPRRSNAAPADRCKLMRLSTRAAIVLGPAGMAPWKQIEMRDAKAIQIFEGTNQIQRLIIAKDLLARASA